MTLSRSDEPSSAPAREERLSRGTWPTSRRLGIPAFLGLLAFLLSWVGSWNVSLWADEAATISAARRSLPDLWRLVHHIDAVHGTYYAFMHIWTGMFGFSAVSLRVPSAIAVGLATIGVWVLAGRLANRRVALAAAAVFGVLPRVTWMGIEARSFAFSALAAIWLTVTLWYLLDRDRGWLRVAYAALTALAVAINLYVGLLVIVHAIIVWTRNGTLLRQRLSWSGAAVVGCLLASPVVLESVGQSAQLGQNGLDWPQLLRSILVNQWFLGATPTTTTGLSLAPTPGLARLWLPAGVGLTLLAVALVLGPLLMELRSRTRWQQQSWEIVRWCGIWIVLPTVVVALYSMLFSPVYNPRYFSFAAPAVAIMVGAGICALSRPWLRVVAGGLVVTLALPIYLSQRQVYGKSGTDWSQVAQFVAAHGEPGQGVYFSPIVPPVRGVVGPTVRTIATAYPKVFARLDDLTLVDNGTAAGSLTASSRPLAAASGEFATVGVIWVISRFDESITLRQDDFATLAAAGLCVGLSWTGPLDSVTAFGPC